MARHTISATTQAGVRNILLPGERKMWEKAPWLKFLNIKGKFYTNLMFSKVKLLDDHKSGSIFTNNLGYNWFYPWILKLEHLQAFTHLLMM